MARQLEDEPEVARKMTREVTADLSSAEGRIRPPLKRAEAEQEMRRLRAKGKTMADIAKHFGVSVGAVSEACRRWWIPSQEGARSGYSPKQIEDIRRRRAAGESLRSIARTYGISHQVLAKICSRRGITSGASSGPDRLLAEHQPELERLVGLGWSIARIGEELGFSESIVREAMRKAELEPQAPSRRRQERQKNAAERLAALIGERFGKWVVLEGAPVPAPPGVDLFLAAKVLCRCDCGLENLVQVSNLTKHLSRSCWNCSKKSKTVIPWQRDDDRWFETTARAAADAGIHSNVLLAHRRKTDDPYQAKNGHSYTPHPELGVPLKEFSKGARPVLTGEPVIL